VICIHKGDECSGRQCCGDARHECFQLISAPLATGALFAGSA
jgi:hypothetical protein